MSNYTQQQAAPAAAAAYPPSPPSPYPPAGQAYAAPLPAGYPTKDAAAQPRQTPVETKSRGDGFWEGCCAALCCCCVLETCF